MPALSTAPRPSTQASIHADLTGSDTCLALGLTVHGPSPVLAMCRALITAGHDPDLSLEAWRDGTLCLRIGNIGEAAGIEVSSGGTGFIKPARALRTAPLVRFGGGR